ncbi:hypothetical protein ABZ608_36800 [Streptomyces sp. NPDC013172]|uniref:hypothetical protein n=1 Tax=Streptomyces sp. NPDC013172 TaxID=3155009 RepID=UPI0033EF78B6
MTQSFHGIESLPDRGRFTHRWHTRLTQLCAVNPHLTTTGSASPALLARDLVTYPETVALARALTTLPSRRHHDTDDAIAFITQRLGLARLALAAPCLPHPHTPLTSTSPHPAQRIRTAAHRRHPLIDHGVGLVEQGS